MSSDKIKRWAPFALVTLGYVLILRVALYSVYYLVHIYSLRPTIGIDEIPVLNNQTDWFTVFLAILLKWWNCLPQKVIFGTSVWSQIVEFIVGSIYGVSLTALCYLTWIFSTRVQITLGKYPTPNNVWWNGALGRKIMFSTIIAAGLLQFLVYATLPIYHFVLPSVNDSIQVYQHAGTAFTEVNGPRVQNMTLLDELLLLIPVLPVVGLLSFMFKKWKEYPEHKNIFLEWKYRSGVTSTFFSHQEIKKHPDVVIGPDYVTNELIVQRGEDRNLNNIIVGSIGTGKTSALIIPTSNQDMHYMVDMINNIDTDTPKDQESRLNGLSVIEPSNDLCQKLYQLALAHNIPEEAIYYLDPTNPNTKSINPLRGPIEKVVETFTAVIQALADGTDEFFKQAQRSHLKHYVYLLKLAKGNDATFDDLMMMYNDMYIVKNHIEMVEGTIPYGWQNIEDRDLRNHWYIVDGVCKWFRERGIEFAMDRKTGMKLYYEDGPKKNLQVILDKQADFVQGLRNILNDIAASKLMRRVLFGNSDFDPDVHLKSGGILLVNTARGEMSDLSDTLGRFVLLMLNNAVFRRTPNTDPYHHVIIDEFPGYFYKSFPSVPAQSRKYKTIITIACQSLAQLSSDYGDDTMYVLMSTMRHKMCYADIDPKTAKVFSEYFGEDDVFESSFSEQMTPSISSAPGRREGTSVTKTKKVRLTQSDIIHLPKFVVAAKLVEENASQPVRLAKANFVPAPEFKQAKVLVDPEKGKKWLEYRQELMRQMNEQLLQDVGIVKEGEANPRNAVPQSEYERLDNVKPKNEQGEIKQLEENMVTMEFGKDHPAADNRTTHNEQPKSPVTQESYDQKAQREVAKPFPQTQRNLPQGTGETPSARYTQGQEQKPLDDHDAVWGYMPPKTTDTSSEKQEKELVQPTPTQQVKEKVPTLEEENTIVDTPQENQKEEVGSQNSFQVEGNVPSFDDVDQRETRETSNEIKNENPKETKSLEEIEREAFLDQSIYIEDEEDNQEDLLKVMVMSQGDRRK